MEQFNPTEQARLDRETSKDALRARVAIERDETLDFRAKLGAFAELARDDGGTTAAQATNFGKLITQHVLPYLTASEEQALADEIELLTEALRNNRALTSAVVQAEIETRPAEPAEAGSEQISLAHTHTAAPAEPERNRLAGNATRHAKRSEKIVQAAAEVTDEQRRTKLIAAIRDFLERTFGSMSSKSPAVGARILLKSGGARQGYFRNWDGFAQAALKFDGTDNVHLGLNPLKHAALDRAREHIDSKGVAAAFDYNDVIRRSVFGVDLDPQRPDKKECATDAEKACAYAKAIEVRAWLTGRGFPEPLLCDSGNGYYLLYRIDLPCDEKTDALFRNCLNALAERFSDDAVKIDTTMADRAQLWRVIGTMNVKGSGLGDRPWRRSAILEGPATFADRIVVDATLLASLSALASRAPKNKKADGWNFELAKYLTAFPKVKVWRGPFDVDGGQKWIFVSCPFNGEHEHHPGEAYAIRYDSGFVIVRCSHDTCAGLDVADMRDAQEPAGWRDRKPDPFRPDAHKPTGADKIIRHVMGALNMRFFHDEHRSPFVTVTLNGHDATFDMSTKSFEDIIGGTVWAAGMGAVSKYDMTDVVNSLSAQAKYDGQPCKVALRSTYDKATRTVYIDQGDPDWHVFKITKEGWTVIPYSACPVRFRRGTAMASFPTPIRGGAIDSLWKYVNCLDEHKARVLAWLVFQLSMPDVERYHMFPTGVEGSGKTVAARFLKRLTDPGLDEVRVPVNDIGDLEAAVKNTRGLVYDNQSFISNELSELFCNLATGGSWSGRKLYTDNDETLFAAYRSLIITSIVSLTQRADLMSRVLNVELKPITKKRAPSALLEEFEKDEPAILGALFDIIAAGLRNFETVELKDSGRMVDFERMACAALPTGGIPIDKVVESLAANRDEGQESLTSNSMVLPILIAIANGGPYQLGKQFGGFDSEKAWIGTPAELLAEVRSRVPDADIRRGKGFPKTPQALAAHIRRGENLLKRAGVYVNTARETRPARRDLKIIGLIEADRPLSYEDGQAMIAWVTRHFEHGATTMQSDEARPDGTIAYKAAMSYGHPVIEGLTPADLTIEAFRKARRINYNNPPLTPARVARQTPDRSDDVF